MILNQQTRVIVWAQWRAIFNRFPRQKAGLIFTWIFSLIWYAGFAALGVGAAFGLPYIHERALLLKILDFGLLGAMVYWQFVPLMMVSSGMSLDLKRLRVYPIPDRRLFGIEVLLRASTGVEVLLVLTGAAVGLWRSPIVAWWGPLFLVPFMGVNLCLSAGIRDLLSRIMRRKGIREIVVLGFILITQAPNFVMRMVPHEKLAEYAKTYDRVAAVLPFPWRWAARLAMGDFSWIALFGLAIAAVIGVWFGYNQFQRGLRFDEAAAESSSRKQELPPGKLTLLERVAAIPLRLFPEPLATLVQKELLSLPRTPRFRTLFLMGAFFSLVIWLPYLSNIGGGANNGFMAKNFLTIVVLYSMMLLTEPLFANVFAYDRKAAQAYFVLPVRFATVLIAKNLTAGLFILLEVLFVCLLAKLFRAPLTLQSLSESLSTVLVFITYLMAVGNLTSVRYAKGVDPSNPWRGKGSGKGGGWLMLVYAAVLPGTVLAHLARYGFNNGWAFLAVQGAWLLIGLITFAVCFELAVESADKQRETFLAALGEGEGVIA